VERPTGADREFFMFFLAACQKTVIDMPLRNQDSWRFDRFES
jgi:multiple sugar transport system substrate-binding protein